MLTIIFSTQTSQIATKFAFYTSDDCEVVTRCVMSATVYIEHDWKKRQEQIAFSEDTPQLAKLLIDNVNTNTSLL